MLSFRAQEVAVLTLQLYIAYYTVLVYNVNMCLELVLCALSIHLFTQSKYRKLI